MRKCYYLFAFCLIGYAGNAQTETNGTRVVPDFVIGDYGVSLKNKGIGRYQIFDCGEGNLHAECYGYFKADDIDFGTTSLVFFGGDMSFIEDVTLDLESLKVIDEGYDSQSDSRRREGLYIDKYIATSNLVGGKIIDSLKGFEYLEKQFLSKGDSLVYLDTRGIYKLNDKNVIDRNSFTPIIKNLFYDRNAVYYVEYGYSSIGDEKFADIKKLLDLETGIKPSVTITDHYYVINNKVYDANRVDNELKLDPSNINQIILHEYFGGMLLFDDTTVYDKQEAHYSFNEVLCDTEYEKEQIECLFSDASNIQKLRETGFVEYHMDYENKSLYFDANKNLKLTETSGNLYSINGGFYFNDFDRFSLKLKAVNIWNPILDAYEPLDLKEYQYINKAFYYYKGNLYGNHSELIQENFSLENARVLKTDRWIYIVNKDLIIDLPESRNLDLEQLQVLKTKSNDASNYLVGDDYLIYNNQIIEGVHTKEISVLDKDILKTPTKLINAGDIMELSTFPFAIKVLE